MHYTLLTNNKDHKARAPLTTTSNRSIPQFIKPASLSLTYSNETYIRSIGEVYGYLEHFAPSLSASDALSTFILNPISIIFNICFIIYNFSTMHTDSNGNYTTESLDDIHNITTWMEMVGLFALFIGLLISYCIGSKTTLVRCIKLCGSWSVFTLFYIFRPLQLVNLYMTMFKHHPSRITASNNRKQRQFDRIQTRLQHHADDQRTDIFSKDELIEVLSQFESRRQDTKTLSPAEQSSFADKIVRYGVFILMIIVTMVCLFIGILSFVFKLGQFSFVHSTEILCWKLSDYILIMGFANQLWNMCNVDAIRMDAIYRFIFSSNDAKFTRFISKKMLLLDSVIKQQLCQSYGFKGFLVALDLKSTILQKIVLKHHDDISMDQLLLYHEYTKMVGNELKRPTNILYRVHSALDKILALKSHAIHPYVAAKKAMLRMNQKKLTPQQPMIYCVGNSGRDSRSYECNYNKEPTEESKESIEIDVDRIANVMGVYQATEDLISSGMPHLFFITLLYLVPLSLSIAGIVIAAKYRHETSPCNDMYDEYIVDLKTYVFILASTQIASLLWNGIAKRIVNTRRGRVLWGRCNVCLAVFYLAWTMIGFIMCDTQMNYYCQSEPIALIIRALCWIPGTSAIVLLCVWCCAKVADIDYDFDNYTRY